jgi:glycosyl transferase family 2
LALNRFALIPTRNRHADLLNAVDDIQPQVDRIYIIDNGSEPPVHEFLCGEGYPLDRLVVIRDSEQPPNLSRLWNMGLNQISLIADPDHKVAVLNDDTRIPPGWFDAVTEAMDRTGAAAGCSSPWNGRLTQEILKTVPDSDVVNRMVGWAFILRGSAKIRAFEALRWWWGDTDMDWQARARGGMVIIPSHRVDNLYPNASTTGVLAEQAGRDRETFKKIYGWNPW